MIALARKPSVAGKRESSRTVPARPLQMRLPSWVVLFNLNEFIYLE